jgi:hypothetical protein
VDLCRLRWTEGNDAARLLAVNEDLDVRSPTSLSDDVLETDRLVSGGLSAVGIIDSIAVSSAVNESIQLSCVDFAILSLNICPY